MPLHNLGIAIGEGISLQNASLNFDECPCLVGYSIGLGGII